MGEWGDDELGDEVEDVDEDVVDVKVVLQAPLDRRRLRTQWDR